MKILRIVSERIWFGNRADTYPVGYPTVTVRIDI